MTAVHKTMHGVERMDKKTFLSCLRKFRTVKKKCFTQHMVNACNSLPQDVVMSISLAGFKKGFKKFMEDRLNNGY